MPPYPRPPSPWLIFLPLRWSEMTGLRVSDSMTYLPGMACDTVSRVTGCGFSGRSAPSLFKPQMYEKDLDGLLLDGSCGGTILAKRRWVSSLLVARRSRFADHFGMSSPYLPQAHWSSRYKSQRVSCVTILNVCPVAWLISQNT